LILRSGKFCLTRKMRGKFTPRLYQRRFELWVRKNVAGTSPAAAA
jgi:hypothetical protein